MKRFFIIILALLCSIMLISCSTEIFTPFDELKMYKWVKTDNYGMSVTLSFYDECAELTVLCADGKQDIISGAVTSDAQSFTIADPEKKSTYTFGYILHGSFVDLSYNGSSIPLDKAV